MRYIPHTAHDIQAMLAVLGVDSVEDLIRHLPADLRKQATLNLAPGLAESDVIERLTALSEQQTGPDLPFLGAGAYPHLVPVVVDQIVQRAEFATAYTPYQPEVSQGTLQAIFEFQSLIAALLGLEVANASMYDGASATAEAVLMRSVFCPNALLFWSPALCIRTTAKSFRPTWTVSLGCRWLNWAGMKPAASTQRPLHRTWMSGCAAWLSAIRTSLA